MPFRKCEQNGWVWRRGGKHCPACGKKLLALSLCPFKVYIPAGTTGILLGVAAVVSLIWFAATYTKSTLGSMPPQWRSLYNAIGAIRGADDRYAAFDSFMKESGDDMPPLAPAQLDKFMGLFKTSAYYSHGVRVQPDKSGEAFVLLQPYILSAEPDQ